MGQLDAVRGSASYAPAAAASVSASAAVAGPEGVARALAQALRGPLGVDAATEIARRLPYDVGIAFITLTPAQRKEAVATAIRLAASENTPRDQRRLAGLLEQGVEIRAHWATEQLVRQERAGRLLAGAQKVEREAQKVSSPVREHLLSAARLLRQDAARVLSKKQSSVAAILAHPDEAQRVLNRLRLGIRVSTDPRTPPTARGASAWPALTERIVNAAESQIRRAGTADDILDFVQIVAAFANPVVAGGIAVVRALVKQAEAPAVVARLHAYELAGLVREGTAERTARYLNVKFVVTVTAAVAGGALASKVAHAAGKVAHRTSGEVAEKFVTRLVDHSLEPGVIFLKKGAVHVVAGEKPTGR